MEFDPKLESTEWNHTQEELLEVANKPSENSIDWMLVLHLIKWLMTPVAGTWAGNTAFATVLGSIVGLSHCSMMLDRSANSAQDYP